MSCSLAGRTPFAATLPAARQAVAVSEIFSVADAFAEFDFLIKVISAIY